MAGGLKILDAIHTELIATCDALGYNDGTSIYLDRNSLEAIKDLIRYLRRDDDTHSVRRYLGQSKLLQKDLLKIFVEHADKLELWNVLLRLIINLTSPALMVYNEELPTEKITRSYYMQILLHLQDYKSAMVNEDIWTVVYDKLKNVLLIDSSERGEEEELIIDRILTLIRNVLRIPPNEYENRTDNDTTVHDQVLFALYNCNIADLLVFMASSNKEQLYHMQILEIVSFMLQGQNPAMLAKVELQRNNLEKQEDNEKLLLLRNKEKSEKLLKVKKYAGARHSKFGGTFVVQNMKSIGDNEMLCHKPYERIEDLNFSVTKQKTKKRKNKNGIANLCGERISALSVRFFLKEFCVEFLRGAYNPVMRYARSCINGAAGATMDSSHYLWALRFFMNFNRHYKFHVKYVSETISTEVFYIVQRQIDHNYEMIQTDKKKIPYWSIRLHLAINAYQELLNSLIEMNKSTVTEVKSSSRVIMNNIFYVPEYRDTILFQLLNYNELTMSRDYLVDLVTTVHIFLKMLKNYCEKERHVVIKKVKRKKPKKKAKPTATIETPSAPPPSLEDRWDDVGPEVSAVLQQNTIPEVIPFDATIDTPIDEQKGDAMKRIQKLLRCNDLEQAIGLLRSARSVWPENDNFGRANLPVEEEFLVLREIFFADLGEEEIPVDSVQNQNGTEGHDEGSLNSDDGNEEDEDEEDEQPQYEESNFDFMDFLHRFANVRVVRNLTILFQQFDKNSVELNHYILKMFVRIATDCKMPAMLYQASIFRVFQRIFKLNNREYKELAAFAIFIFRGFAAVAARNPKAYMELLFWKSTKQAVEMTDGYETEHSVNKKQSRNAWSETEEDELRTLFMEHQTNKYSEDLIEFLLKNLINQDRTSRGIIKKLKELYLIVNSKDVRNEVRKRLPKEWSEEETAQLTELWEQVKEEDDPVGLIYDSLRIKRSKPKIKEKLLELHLVDDIKQLRKKRSKKSDGPKSSWENPSSSEGGSGSESDAGSDDGEDRSKGKKEKKKKKEKPQKPKKKLKQPTIVYTDAQLSGLLKDVIAQNMQEALQWLKESLEESLEDRDEESTESQALVPLTAETSAALDSPSFQRFLRGLGIEPPDLEEAYWRVPAGLLPNTINNRCTLIEKALRGEFVEEIIVSKRKDESESDDDDVFERVKKYSKMANDVEESTSSTSTKLRKSASQKSASQKSVSQKSTSEKSVSQKSVSQTSSSQSSASQKTASQTSSSQSSASQKTASQKSASQKSTATRKKDSDSSTDNSDSDKENSDSEIEKLSTGKSQSRSKRLKTFLESSDSEEEQKLRNDTKDSSENAVDTINTGDTKVRNNKSKRIIDTDSEEEKMVTQSQSQTDALNKSGEKEGNAKSSRIRKVVDSDSEEDVAKNLLENEDKLLSDDKRSRSENSDSEAPVQKKRRILDSDDEDDVMQDSEKSEVKNKVIALIDDEDDE